MIEVNLFSALMFLNFIALLLWENELKTEKKEQESELNKANYTTYKWQSFDKRKKFNILSNVLIHRVS